MPWCIRLWSPLLQFGLPPAKLGSTCLSVCLVPGLLPILVLAPLPRSSFLYPGGASGVDLLHLPLGCWRSGLPLLYRTCGVGGRRFRFPTHGTWLRHLGPLLLLKVRISAISSLPASICAGRRIYAQESLGVCILRGRSVYRSIIYYICISVIRCIRVSRCLDVGT